MTSIRGHINNLMTALVPDQPVIQESIAKKYVDGPSRRVSFVAVGAIVIIHSVMTATNFANYTVCTSEHSCQMHLTSALFSVGSWIVFTACFVALFVKPPIFLPILMAGTGTLCPLNYYFYVRPMMNELYSGGCPSEAAMRVAISKAMSMMLDLTFAIFIHRWKTSKIIIAASGLAVFIYYDYSTIPVGFNQIAMGLVTAGLLHSKKVYIFNLSKALSDLTIDKTQSLKLFDHLRVGCLVLSKDRNVLFHNKTFADMCGYEKEVHDLHQIMDDTKGIFSPIVISPKSVSSPVQIKVPKNLEEVVNDTPFPANEKKSKPFNFFLDEPEATIPNVPVFYEFSMKKLNGPSKTIELSIQETIFDAEEAVMLLFQDSSPFKDHALDSEASKNDVLTVAANEAKLALENNISIMSNALKTNTNDDLSSAVESTKLEVQVIESLIADSAILGASHEIRYDVTEIVVSELVQELHEIFDLKAKSLGIELVVALLPGVPEKLTGDKQKLKQVLFHLISSGLNSTAKGRIYLTVEKDKRTAGMITFQLEHSSTIIKTDDQVVAMRNILNSTTPHHIEVMNHPKALEEVHLTLAQKLAAQLGVQSFVFDQNAEKDGYYVSFNVPKVLIVEAVTPTHDDHHTMAWTPRLRPEDEIFINMEIEGPPGKVEKRSKFAAGPSR